MGDDRGEALTPVPGTSDEKRPSGLPPAESTARRLEVDGGKRADAEPADGEPVDGERKERRDPTPVTRLRPPKSNRPPPEEAEGDVRGSSRGGADAGTDAGTSDAPRRSGDPKEMPSAPTPSSTSSPSEETTAKKAPEGLKHMTTSARRRLQLALDEDDEDGEPVAKKPRGLRQMTPSARLRLQLALDEDVDEMEAFRPPRLPSSETLMAVGYIPFDEDARKIVGSLSRWVAFCGLLTLAVGALTGLSYLTGPGSVAHVVVGILATALSVWLLAAGWSFRRVLTQKRQQHHLVNALGLLRSALLLKAILLFSGMVLGCFTFSIATGLLLLL